MAQYMLTVCHSGRRGTAVDGFGGAWLGCFVCLLACYLLACYSLWLLLLPLSAAVVNIFAFAQE